MYTSVSLECNRRQQFFLFVINNKLIRFNSFGEPFNLIGFFSSNLKTFATRLFVSGDTSIFAGASCL